MTVTIGDLTVRREVHRFALEMERVMQLNEIERGKGDSWRECPESYLWDKLREEYSEAIQPDADPQEFLDLAVVAMFLWYRQRMPGKAGVR